MEDRPKSFRNLASMAEPTTRLTPDEPKKKSPWLLTIFGLLAAGGLIAMPFLAGEPNGEKMPDIVRFIGHFHPVLLHLPIGVFMLIICQELGAIFFRKSGERRETTVFPMFFGAASAVVAVLAGFLLYHGDKDGAYVSDIGNRHLWGGLIFAVVALITMIVKAWTVSRVGNQAFYRALLFGSVCVMSFASHDGASMTHGSDYLTKYAPNPIRKMLGLPVIERPKLAEEQGHADPVVYADIVAPIFEAKCVQCHKEGNTKGRFRMDTYELLVKGGKEDVGLVAGDAAKSNIMVRIHLPKDDEEHMPPEDKKQLDSHEIEIIEWWIATGADPAKKLSELPPSDKVKEALAKLGPVGGAKAKAEEKKPTGPGDDLKVKVADLSKQFPGVVTFESQDSALVVFAGNSLRGNLDDAGFAKVEPVYAQLVSLDLNATKVTDASVAKLANAKNLKRIRLAETAITDASIDTLVKLNQLESINLYGTKVTDAGIAKLSALPNLKTLFIWQTSVTPEAIAALKQKLPNLEVNTGI